MAIASVILYELTKSPEKYQLSLESYDFEKGNFKKEKVNIKKESFYNVNLGEWFIYSKGDKGRFKEIYDFMNSISFPVGKKIYKNKNLSKILFNKKSIKKK